MSQRSRIGRSRLVSCVLLLTAVVAAARTASAQPVPADRADEIAKKTRSLNDGLAALRSREAAKATKNEPTLDPRWIADVAVYAKAAEWIVRHEEFFTPQYADQTTAALDVGAKRLAELVASKGDAPSWLNQPGSTIRGFASAVDDSVQPYALTLPADFDPKTPKRWPLHVNLHGRGAQLNEVNFLFKSNGKAAPADQTWIQLDIFGRTNNAYRWAGETDVFEALTDVERRYRIDPLRITLRGFSMGGAGAWHLGLHHPSRWCSVGPGAGFVDFYGYQKIKEPLAEHQHKTLRIYDAVQYALNAYDVPVCTYGGEIDPQLQASLAMVERAKPLGTEIKLIVGPQTGHKFHPDSLKEFMAFHKERSDKGRLRFPGLKNFRFVTCTLKYNQIEWLTIDEVEQQYEPTIVESKFDADSGDLKLRTHNVAILHVARDVSDRITLDGKTLPLRDAAEGLLPDVYYEKGKDGWFLVEYDDSKAIPENLDLQKRHDLQGPIDDAFMQPFVCVRGTGTPWSAEQQAWADWTLSRFEREFDKWMRGRIPVVNDKDVTPELIEGKNLILFGDPGSNSTLARVIGKLPVTWTKDAIEVDGATYDPKSHGVSLIYPNPLNPRRYVVVNSGHTFHEDAFKASNAWLFPRLGDVAVQKFEKTGAGYAESVVWAALFNSGWKLPPKQVAGN